MISTPSNQNNDPTVLPQSTEEVAAALRRISTHPTLTPFRRRVYRTLLSIPPGQWTTYGVLADYLSSSPRAVGNALRTNPFAPQVPCHRVLAADRSLCGYKGEKEGYGGLPEKRALLEKEGVEFDEKGRARGQVFEGLVDLGEKSRS